MGSSSIAKSTVRHGRSLLTGGPCPHHQRRLEESSSDKPCRALLSCVTILTKHNFVSVSQAQTRESRTAQEPGNPCSIFDDGSTAYETAQFNVLATFGQHRSAQKRHWRTLVSQASQLGYNIKLLLSSDLRENPNIRVHGTIVVADWSAEVEKSRRYGAVVELLSPREWDLKNCLAKLHEGMTKRWN